MTRFVRSRRGRRRCRRERIRRAREVARERGERGAGERAGAAAGVIQSTRDFQIAKLPAVAATARVASGDEGTAAARGRRVVTRRRRGASGHVMVELCAEWW